MLMGQLWAVMLCCSIQDDVINYMDHMVKKNNTEVYHFGSWEVQDQG